MHLGKHLFVDGRVLGRNKGGHAPIASAPRFVAGLDEESRVGREERFVHGHHLTIRQDAIRVIFQGLDIAEDVVPAAAVEGDDVILHLIEQLVHLEYRRQGFDEHGGLDGTARGRPNLSSVQANTSLHQRPSRWLCSLGT